MGDKKNSGNELGYTVGGSLTGLLGALALRKMIDWDTPIDWKDLLLWGGSGAALGGLVGYGAALPPVDPNTLATEQKDELNRKIDEQRAQNVKLREQDEKDNEERGMSMLGFLDRFYGTAAGAGLGVWNYFKPKLTWAEQLKVDALNNAAKSGNAAPVNPVRAVRRGRLKFSIPALLAGVAYDTIKAQDFASGLRFTNWSPTPNYDKGVKRLKELEDLKNSGKLK